MVVELWDHGDPLDSARNDALVALADRCAAEIVATNNVHYHHPARRPLATALAAVRARRSLDDIDGWLPAAAAAHLRGGRRTSPAFRPLPRRGGAGRRAGPGLRLRPGAGGAQPAAVAHPAGPHRDELAAAPDRGGRACAATAPATRPRHPRAWAQIDYELDMIEQLGFAGYFLIVWDIVEFCRTHDIYCQGRGSAANSAVCYALGITNADAVALGLLFERFLSPERDGPPDIDVDIESGRREEVIQYVYRRYGRGCAAQVANVITYRPRSAVRDMGKALGAAPGQLDAWSKQVDGWGPLSATAALADHDIPDAVMALAGEVQHFPRHLGIHSGGMVLCDRPVAEVCPVEWARMADRSVLQWDKDDCAAAGLVKFDMLGLGMLTVLHAAVDHVRAFHGVEVDLARLDQEPEVYEMLSRADSVGVFQVESRAQMATLPRLKPRTLLRPGGGGGADPARADPGRVGASLHPPAQRGRGGDLPAPAAGAQPGQDAGGAAVPGAADADGHRRGRVHRRPSRTGCARPWAPSAAWRRWSSCGPGCTRGWRSGGSPVRWPTRSTTSWWPSPTSVSPRAIR